MKRGVLTLDSPELDQLQPWLNGEILTPLLIQKLKTQTDQDLTSKIELSEEEGECLLDLLPMPDAREPISLTSLRKKLQLFLQNLRHF